MDELSKFLNNLAQFTPKYYKMDPQTEDLVSNGKNLANGMRVLLADPNDRERPEDVDGRDWKLDRLEERNRWCTVGALEVKDDLVRFVAVYDDGSKRLRTCNVSVPWLVKIDSIRESENKATDLYRNVYALVKGAMDDVTEAVLNEYTHSPDRVADYTTKKILGLL